MISSLTSEDADITFDCLDAGAVDFVLKPGTISLKPEQSEAEILSKIKAALHISKNRLVIRKTATSKKIHLTKKQQSGEVSGISDKNKDTKFEKMVLIGSSTGGPGLIEDIVKNIPDNYPYPIIVVQHMPDNFTAGFAKRLNNYTNLEVVESTNSGVVYKNQIIIAKGGVHLILGKKANGDIITKHKPKNHRFYTPSVDEMFLSAVKVFDVKNILAVELTGIGDDGADGMLELKKRGAYTIAEDETTAVVYGMPKSCWERGAAQKKMPFPNILQEIIKYGK
jgi:two-component system chemotaxis response regulator CheB